MKRSCSLLIALLLTANSGSVVTTQAQVAGQPAAGTTGSYPDVAPQLRRVLALYSESSDQPAILSFAQQFQDVLKRQSGNTVEHYPEYFDSVRFPGESEKRAMVDYLRHKYAHRKIDVLFAWGPFTLPLVLEYRSELFPDTPIVYYSGTLDEVKDYPLPPMTGVLNRDTYATTLALALALHPDATEAFIISGTPARDKAIERDVSRQLKEFKGRVTLTYLTDLPLDRLIATVRSLPRRSIIIYSRQQAQEDTSRVMQQADYVDLVSRSARVPVYGPWRSLLGHGSVGGVVDDREAGATKAAEIVLRIVRGARPQDIPPDRTPRVPTFDARQLKRWGISEDRLPSGSVVLFREPTIWSQYRRYIIGTGVVLGVQTLMIGALLVQRARRRGAESAVRESEERFRVMADTAPVLIWRAKTDNERDFFNKPWLEFRGRSMEEEAGSGWTEGVHPADVEQCLTTYTSAFDERRPFRMEYRLQRVDGEYRWVLDTGVPRFTPAGTFVGYIGSCLDITERKQAEEALQESEKRYALATTAGSVAVWAWNLETNAIYADPALKALLGVSDSEIEDHLDAWIKRVHPDDVSHLLTVMRDCVDGRTAYFENEHRILHKDGSPLWFHARGSAICLPDGAAVEMTGTITDITERKRAEARLHKVQEELARVSRLTALGEFAASIAHELGHPLNAILLNAKASLRWLEDPAPPIGDVRSALRDIAEAGDRANQVVRRNRALFRHHTVEKQPLDVSSLIRDVTQIAGTRLQNSRVQVDTRIHGDLPLVVGDRVELQQVLLNLLLNAMEAMETVHSKTRRVLIEAAVAERWLVQITVRDSGIGLAGVELGRIFSAFYTTKPEGTGVGLSICRSIVEAHGGRIWVGPNDGPGATFCFTIPVARAASTGTSSEANEGGLTAHSRDISRLPTPRRHGRPGSPA